MKWIQDYNAPPSQLPDPRLEKIDGLTELQEIREEMGARPENGTEAAFDFYDSDLQAIERAELLLRQGKSVYVTRDDDGLFFATD